MERIADREALGQVREASKAQVADSRCRILICAGTGCLAGGSGEIYERMCELVKDHPDVEVHFGPEIAHGNGEISVKKSGCHGFCEMGPLMRIEPLRRDLSQNYRKRRYYPSSAVQAGWNRIPEAGRDSFL